MIDRFTMISSTAAFALLTTLKALHASELPSENLLPSDSVVAVKFPTENELPGITSTDEAPSTTPSNGSTSGEVKQAVNELEQLPNETQLPDQDGTSETQTDEKTAGQGGAPDVREPNVREPEVEETQEEVPRCCHHATRREPRSTTMVAFEFSPVIRRISAVISSVDRQADVYRQRRQDRGCLAA